MAVDVDKLNQKYFFSIPAKAERKIAKLFRQASAELRDLVYTLSEKYGDNLTYQEMVKYNRLAAVNVALADVVLPAMKTSTKMIVDLKTGIFQDAYYRELWAAEQKLGTRLPLRPMTVGKAEEKAVSPLDKTDEASEVRLDQKQAVERLKTTLRRDLGAEKTTAQIIDDIKAEIIKTENAQIRVMWTEVLRAMTSGQMEASNKLAELGVVSRKQWVATLDDRTRPEHARMDGKYANEDGYFETPVGEILGPRLSGDPSWDINCRCVFINDLEGWEPTERRQRAEYVNGEPVEPEVIPYTTFDNWVADKGWIENRYRQKYLSN